jgi:2-polyprenyl-3-methyl-5-hydroxy-6-metoxy-1,4-benzoquinol methylase
VRVTGFDQAKFDALQEKVLSDVAGAMGVFMGFIGDRTGLYRALADHGRCRSDELARLAGVDPRYLREWLSSNAANGYVEYHPEDDTFSLSEEQIALFAVDGTTRNVHAMFDSLVSQVATYEAAIDEFRSGRGRPWGAQCSCCFAATNRGFGPVYSENLVQKWIPALDGVAEILHRGGTVADIGCGLGHSTRLLAQAFPKTEVRGFDFHQPSVEEARGEAAAAGTSNVTFAAADSKDFPGIDYDLICIFDALHDMGDPVGVARYVRSRLKPEGTFMVVEPRAEDKLVDNRTAISAIMYGFSTTICLPASRSQEVGLCLGAQAGEKRITDVLSKAGFSRIRRASESDLNMVLEARP